MKTNADLSLRATRNIHDLAWEESGMQGVLRKRLDQDESAPPIERVTTVVKFAANSYFSPHTHDGGEEFLVLDGVFSDQHADYPTGSYVRNPIGTKHKPFSEHGCTILVKLWQMQNYDQQHIVVNTSDDSLWLEADNHCKTLELFSNDFEANSMIKWPKGYEFKPHKFERGVEYFVLDGCIKDDSGEYKQGSWLRLPAQSEHSFDVLEDCLVYRKTGHL